MSWVVLVMVILGGTVLQTLLPALHLLADSKLPILPGIVIYYALTRHSGYALTAGLLAGFLQDAVSPIPMGLSTLTFCLLAWVTGRFRNLVMPDSMLPPMLFGAVGGAATTLLLYILLVRHQPSSWPAGWVATKILGTGLLGIFCTPMAFLTVGWLDRKLGNVAAKEGPLISDLVE